MNVLVTGGAGFIGSHLVDALVGLGHRVRVLDDFATGHFDNLRHLTREIDLIEGTILDAHALRRAMEKIEVVFHHAAIASVPHSVRNPILSNEVNVTGTLHVLTVARDAGARRVIYAASSSAYGDTQADALVETMRPLPLSPYAVAKLAGEHYCQVFARFHGLETVCLRYFNVFGPRQDPRSEYAAVIPKFITALLDGRPLTFYGDGTQSRDFTYVENVIAANLLAMATPGASGEVFNVGYGRRTSLQELVRQLGRVAGAEPELVYLPPGTGDVAHSLADISKARAFLNYEPPVSLAAGLRRTWEYFATQPVGAQHSVPQSLVSLPAP